MSESHKKFRNQVPFFLIGLLAFLLPSLGFGLTMTGDFDNDGDVDRDDMTILLAEVRSPGPHDPKFDLNGDGVVNRADARTILGLCTLPRCAIPPTPDPNDVDDDSDGFTENQGDCDDGNAGINPGATDIPGNGIDEDCSGADATPDPNDVDNDGDGFTENQGDCDDGNAGINPGATDIPGNGIDEDCSGSDAPATDIIPPQINIISPEDGAEITDPSIPVTGTATDETALAGVTVNGIAATLNDDAWSATVPLVEGANTITVVATDAAGNTASAGITVTRLAPLPPPQISSVTPSALTIGELLTINGNNFAARSGVQPIVRMNKQGGGQVNAPVANFDAAHIEITIPASAANGPLTVNVAGQQTTSTESLMILPSSDFTLSVTPSVLQVIQGQSGSLVVAINSTNNFSQLANLAVSGLPTGITATFNPPQITAGQASQLNIEVPAGQPTATNTLIVSASAIVDGNELNQEANASLTVNAVTTSFVGRTVVDDPQQTPLAGITVSFLGVDKDGNSTGCSGQTVSDAGGNFALTNLPSACVGPQLIRYDGSTATSPPGEYAGVDLLNILVADQVTESPVLIHLPRIDNGETVMVIQNHTLDQTFRFSTIPNLSVTIYAGTVLSLKDGSKPDPFPLTAVEVPVDRLPDEMPPSDTVDPFIVAFQPANAQASQPVAVTFPNLLNTPPGSGLTLMTLDPTKGEMVSYGTGTVSDDGLKIIPDLDPANPGKRFGLVHFDWHGPAGPAPNQTDPCPNGPCGGDPVHFASGLVIEQETDLAIPAPGGGISIERVYRTLSNNAGPFGIGGNHTYSYFLNLSRPGPTSPVINFIVPAGNQFPFTNIGNGILVNRNEPSMRGVTMKINGDSTVDVTFKNGTVFHFVPGGFLLGSVLESITDPNGNQTTLVRNSSNLLQITEIIDSVGRKVKLTYDNSNRITQITDPIGRTVQYTYTSFGRLETVTDAEGGVTRYTYVRPTANTETNQLESITDARGIEIARNFYGQFYGPACGGATGLSDDDLAALPEADRLACVNDSRTVRDGRVWKQIDADGGVMNFRYTLSNESVPLSPVIRTEVTDALGNTTTYRFSTQGQPLNVVDPVGQSLVFEREPGGNLLLQKQGSSTCEFCGDVSAGDSALTYDESGNVLTRTDSLGNVTTFTYGSRFNKVTSATDALGNTSSFDYDASGNLLTTTDANGNTTSMSYNSRGLPVAVTDALGNTTVMTYDTFGNLVKTTDALGNVTQFRYDAVGRLVETVDPLDRRTKLTYDKLNRVISQTDANGQITTFSYDAVGNLLSVTDPRGNTVSFTYDELNRVASRTDAVGKIETFEYDLNGNLIKATDRRGQVHRFEYDGLNRLVKEIYADGSTVDRSYDARGRLVRTVDSVGGVQTFQYDALGRLTRETGANGTIEYEYDPLGRVTSRQIVGQSKVTYAYDAIGNLLSVSDPPISVSFTYDALNRRTGIQRSNGVVTTLDYDALGRTVGIVHRNATGIIDRQTYTYDAAGNRKSLTNTLGEPFITESADAEFDAANRLLRRGNMTYTYDDNGNRISKTNPSGTTTYEWDSRDRLITINEPNGAVTNFVYDAFNNLISQKVSGVAGNVEKNFLVDDLTNVIRQTDSSGQDLLVLTGRAIDDHLAVTKNDGTEEQILRDTINSTVGTTNSGGDLTQGFSYEPFGQSSTGVTTFPIQFTGRQPVSDELYYYRARFYDTEAGRFLSEDPIGFQAGDVNLYRYVFNNSINFVDPNGQYLPLLAAVAVALLERQIVRVAAGIAARILISGVKGTRALTAAGFATGVGENLLPDGIDTSEIETGIPPFETGRLFGDFASKSVKIATDIVSEPKSNIPRPTRMPTICVPKPKPKPILGVPIPKRKPRFGS